MERLVKGDAVVLPFPFSDLSAAKKRPAVILSVLDGEDVILCQVTSHARHDRYSISLTATDFKAGRLTLASFIRPNRLFTADRSLILYKIGSLKESKIREVEEKLIKLIRQ
ncbi:MAG: type II toxin-antitoxin system PemK/MazF family toxin [Nanoarchaeota archaeon]